MNPVNVPFWKAWKADASTDSCDETTGFHGGVNFGYKRNSGRFLFIRVARLKDFEDSQENG